MAGFTQPFEFGFEDVLIGTGEQGIDRLILSDERFFELAAAGGKNCFDRSEVFEQIELGAGADAGQAPQREPRNKGIEGGNLRLRAGHGAQSTPSDVNYLRG